VAAAVADAAATAGADGGGLTARTSLLPTPNHAPPTTANISNPRPVTNAVRAPDGFPFARPLPSRLVNIRFLSASACWAADNRLGLITSGRLSSLRRKMDLPSQMQHFALFDQNAINIEKIYIVKKFIIE
jgi:hypothetical protein